MPAASRVRNEAVSQINQTKVDGTRRISRSTANDSTRSNTSSSAKIDREYATFANASTLRTRSNAAIPREIQSRTLIHVAVKRLTTNDGPRQAFPASWRGSSWPVHACLDELGKDPDLRCEIDRRRRQPVHRSRR